MKATFLAILAFLSVSVGAQTTVDKPVVCMETSVLLSALASEDINEKIQWAGKAEEGGSSFFLFVNQKTKSWTFVQLNKKVACILGTGSQSTDARFTTVKR
jgi:hypothetical protein